MKILLDECLPRNLRRAFPGYEVKTVPEMGWASFSNGRLMALAEKQFDVFLTVDRNLSFQQALPNFNIAVVVISVRSNRLKDIMPFVPKILEAIPRAKAGRVEVVSS